MSTLSAELNIAALPSALIRAGRQFRGDVEGERIIGLGEARVEAVGEHRLGAADPFLGRLDDEHDRALPAVLHRRQPPRGADQRGDVHVVAAGVHHRIDSTRRWPIWRTFEA